MIKPEKRNRLLEKFEEQGWSDLAEFVRRTGVPVARETARVAIYDGQRVSHPILIIIAKYLGFSQAETREILKEAGDKEYWPLIGESKVETTEFDRSLLAAVRAIREADPLKVNILADQIDLVAHSLGLDVTEHTHKIRSTRPTWRSRRAMTRKTV